MRDTQRTVSARTCRWQTALWTECTRTTQAQHRAALLAGCQPCEQPVSGCSAASCWTRPTSGRILPCTPDLCTQAATSLVLLTRAAAMCSWARGPPTPIKRVGLVLYLVLPSTGAAALRALLLEACCILAPCTLAWQVELLHHCSSSTPALPLH